LMEKDSLPEILEEVVPIQEGRPQVERGGQSVHYGGSEGKPRSIMPETEVKPSWDLA